jgi:ribose-phosphate pyrophosphokinase
VERARAYSKRLGTTLAIVDKRRPKANVAEILNLIGDVKGKDAVLLDDMIDTGGTITQAAAALLDKGARSVSAYAVHGVLSGPAIERINNSALSKVVITDTIPFGAAAKASGKFELMSTARVFAEAIRRIHNFDSLSSLFS